MALLVTTSANGKHEASGPVTFVSKEITYSDSAKTGHTLSRR